MFRPLALVLCLAPTAALADLTFCNVSDARATLAIGYKSGGDWVSEGWWAAEPDECRTILSYPLENRYYYYRVTSGSHSWEMDSYMFCTSSDAFEIVGDEDCEARGYDREGFTETELAEGETSFAVTATPYEVFVGYPDPVHDDEEFSDEDVSDEDTRDGSQGEPYTVSGLLSHCDYTDTGVQCELHAPPWIYRAYAPDSPNMSLVEDLEEMPVNTPMTWSGELMFHSSPFAEVTIHSVRFEGTDPYASLRAGLQGLWTSRTDGEYTLLIHGGLLEEWYGGVPTDTR